MVVISENSLFTVKNQASSNLGHFLKQKYPKKHAHYSFEDFFHFQSDVGIVTDWNEGRNLFATEVINA